MFWRHSTVPWCLKFIPIPCMGPKHAPKDTDLIFQPIYMHLSMCMYVVQIWIMHIDALKTQLMHKQVQTNPPESQKFTQHSCCSMLTREKKLKAIRGNGYHFIPKGGTFPTETIMLVVRSSRLCEAYTQTCPKWDKFFTTACWCRSMIACQVSWISDEFWIY